MAAKITCDVAVVGAGLAGLGAADLLVRAGLNAKVFEASSRVGGRVYTTRLPSGERFEEGAFSFSDVEATLVSYIDRFGLKAIPQSTIDKQFKFGDIVGHFSDKGTFLVGPEKDIVLSQLLSYYLPKVPNNDTITFAQGLRQAGASDPAISWLNLNTLVGIQGDGIETVSALAVKQFMAQYNGATTFNTVQGGNDMLPNAMGKWLNYRAILNTPIQQILGQQDSSYLLVSGNQQIVADAVIVAVPLAALQLINFDPPLPADKYQAMTSVPYTSCSRMSIVAPPDIFGGIRGGVFATTDQPAGWFRDQTLFQTNPLQNTVFDISFSGPMARQMDGMNNNSRKQAIIDGLRYFYPNISSQGMKAEFFSWDTTSWVKGGYSYFPPGTISLQSVLSRPEGGLHFAGEHTSDKYASMNGALESGIRAAKEVLRTWEKA
ncbi:MAG: FAD-dependent oxidoreductase [Verrucomicrobia bacterium]|nr:FAD-dependent oxidoreductase [Verrucomicrobiota bacterium]